MGFLNLLAGLKRLGGSDDRRNPEQALCLMKMRTGADVDLLCSTDADYIAFQALGSRAATPLIATALGSNLEDLPQDSGPSGQFAIFYRSPQVRMRLRALGMLSMLKLAGSDISQRLAPLLNDESVDIRLQAAELLGRDKVGNRILHVALAEGNPTQAQAASHGIAGSSRASIQELIQIAQTAESIGTSSEAIRALGTRPSSPRVLEALKVLADEAKPDLQLCAIKALMNHGAAGREILIPILVSSLQSSQVGMHMYIPDYLQRLAPLPDSVVLELVRYLENEKGDPRARGEAARALARLGPQGRTAMPTLLRLLESHPLWIERSTIVYQGEAYMTPWNDMLEALEKLAEPSDASAVVPAIRPALIQTKDPHVRNAATRICKKIGLDSMIEPAQV